MRVRPERTTQRRGRRTPANRQPHAPAVADKWGTCARRLTVVRVHIASFARGTAIFSSIPSHASGDTWGRWGTEVLCATVFQPAFIGSSAPLQQLVLSSSEVHVAADDTTRSGLGWAGPTVGCALLASLVLVVAGCGGGGSPRVASVNSSTTDLQGTSTSNSPPAASQRNKVLAYSRCMRSNGVPAYPDPNSNGNLPKGNGQAFRVSTSQYQAAEQACGNLLPSGGGASLTQCLMTGDCPRSVVQGALEEGRMFARCMRGHGVVNWPDPTVDSLGRPSFQVTKAGMSIDATRAPQMLSKIGDCQRQPGAALLRQE